MVSAVKTIFTAVAQVAADTIGAGTAMNTALDTIKAELTARIAALDVRAPYAEPRDLAGDVDAIRAIAHRHQLDPAVTVTHFLHTALARGDGSSHVHGWLAILGEAVASERQDIAACDAFAATCSMRLAA